MRSPQNGLLLRAFVGEDDNAGGRAVYRAIVERARDAGLAGATVLRGPLSFGHGHHLNSELNIDMPRKTPLVVEIIDTDERIHAFLPQIDPLIGSGLVTLEPIRMFRCGRTTSSTHVSADTQT
jgi:uncharacterized protein